MLKNKFVIKKKKIEMFVDEATQPVVITIAS